ncbi:MAG: acyl-CoA dehydrogenase, partial [Stellaceae bacterium]
ALAYCGAAAIDRAQAETDRAARLRAERRADLLIPVVKAWCTDVGVMVASTGVQVHGGMGYIEETGAAQHLRDARIAPIYEGTNGIQANDLVGRKLGRDQGEAARNFFAEIAASLPGLDGELAPVRARLAKGLTVLERATAFLVAAEPAAAAAGSVPYLALFGTVAGGWLMARIADAAQARRDTDPRFAAAKLATARFYAEHFLTQAPGYLPAIESGAEIAAVDPDLL